MSIKHLQEAIEVLLTDATYQDQQTIIWNILTENFQQIIDEIEEKGRADGHEYGFEEGKAEGKAEAIQDAYEEGWDKGFEKGYEEGKQYGIMLAD